MYLKGSQLVFQRPVRGQSCLRNVQGSRTPRLRAELSLYYAGQPLALGLRCLRASWCSWVICIYDSVYKTYTVWLRLTLEEPMWGRGRFKETNPLYFCTNMITCAPQPLDLPLFVHYDELV